MDSNKRHILASGLALVLLGLSSKLNSVQGTQIVLDHDSDISGVWLDVSCNFVEDYKDFWVYGCPLTPKSDVNLEERSGFWTECQPQQCEIIYHGGFLPKPKKLILNAYISGYSYLTIAGKDNPDEEQFSIDIGYAGAQEQPGWCQQEFDLADAKNLTVLNFTIYPSADGFVLLDNIIIDLGEDIPGPIALDTEVDNIPSHWVYNDCHYMDNYEDFWIFGCPANPLEINPTSGSSGYWFPCKEEKCKIEYAGVPSVIPSTVFVRSYVNGSAEILVTASDGIENSTTVQVISAEKTGEGWQDVNIDISTLPSTHGIQVELVPSLDGDGIALLDIVSVDFISEEVSPSQLTPLPVCTPPQITTTTTVSSSTRPTVSTSSTGPTSPTSQTNPTGLTDLTSPKTSSSKPSGSGKINLSFGLLMVTLIVICMK